MPTRSLRVDGVASGTMPACSMASNAVNSAILCAGSTCGAKICQNIVDFEVDKDIYLPSLGDMKKNRASKAAGLLSQQPYGVALVFFFCPVGST